MKRTNYLIIILIFCGLCAETTAQEPWSPLFNGSNLKGWKQLNGTAKYSVKNGVLVGTTVAGSPNSFLCTAKGYSDFILEFDVWVDPRLNSGVQIRSHSYPEYQNRRVHGYQVEIDPSDRAWSAGIYDEARRAWLYTLAENPDAREAFRQNDWNHYRVEAIGTSIRTWLNEVPAANLSDDMDASGFIALQVHGIGDDPKNAGIQVKWKNIRIITDNPSQFARPMPESVLEISTIPNTLTKKEIRDGWKLLWDGTTTNGWRGADKTGFPAAGWEINDRCLIVNEGTGGESTNGGDIITIDTYKDFDLSVDFMLTTGANSGIKYYVIEGINQGKGSAIGLEYQLLDDANHPDAKQGVGNNRTCAALYDLIPPLEGKKMNPPGQWNTARIIAKGNHIEHWLNGQKTVEYERGTQMYRALVQKSKYAVYPSFGEAIDGHILLQDHGNKVFFRNIKIKPLN
jgi:hypothetical protein